MDKRLYEAIKYVFTQDEKRELGEALAREAQTVFDLKEKKANVAASLAASIKAANSRVADLTNKINNGYEVKEIECFYAFDNPRIGMKTLLRCDTSEQVRIEAMTLDEQQRNLEFGDAPPEK